MCDQSHYYSWERLVGVEQASYPLADNSTSESCAQSYSRLRTNLQRDQFHEKDRSETLKSNNHIITPLWRGKPFLLVCSSAFTRRICLAIQRRKRCAHDRRIIES